VRVVFTRKTDVFIPLDSRAEIANKNKADSFISIHVNAVKKGNASGAETYVLGLGKVGENLEVAKTENSVILMEDDYLQKYEGFDPKSSESYIIFDLMQNKHMEQSIAFATDIQKYFAKANREDRGVRQAGLLVLRKTSMPAVLVELGFITNRDEERYLVSNDGQNELAQAIFMAFTTFKNNHDRKSGNLSLNNTSTPQEQPTESQETKTDKPSAPPPAPSKQEAVYKIQILTSDSRLADNDKRFKGYKGVSFYMEKGIYKYTYGSSSDFSEILRLYRSTVKDFKDAFIVKIKDGKRIE
jgi:N-acetylmuramoyl-L-alanine amidase